MRGKAPDHCFIFNESGITPAYAGKSACDMRAIVSRRDHPRLCGEKPLLIAFTLIQPRITPAYAGKSLSEKTLFPFGEDHPRLCGEKLLLFLRSLIILGSPPPMRGKVVVCCYAVFVLGITPAYAGKSDSEGGMYPQRRDHPRLCGEKDRVKHCGTMLMGSPPPMRGKGGVKTKYQ